MPFQCEKTLYGLLEPYRTAARLALVGNEPPDGQFVREIVFVERTGFMDIGACRKDSDPNRMDGAGL
jgi:hypothetical protein